MKHTKERLLIFTKNPIQGTVKTRLARDIGDKSAFMVYKALIKHTREITRPLKQDKMVWYSRSIDYNDGWDHNLYHKAVQQGDHLGERMENAFEDAFSRRYQKVVIIGTDCYELTTAIIQEAFTKLDDYDVVWGPAKDGGYYLLGLTYYLPDLFHMFIFFFHKGIWNLLLT